MTLRLLQVQAEHGRRVVVAQAAQARLVAGAGSVRDLALAAIAAGHTLADHVAALGYDGLMDIEAAYAEGRIVSPIDHIDPAHLILSGTGLTHLGSAEGRDQMHREMLTAATQTDSMRMFLEGMEGGKPAAGEVGQQPEWFYKGDGSQLVAPGGPITMPHFAQDGGEEPELAGIYVIGPDGAPYRLGFCLGNEFSDHITERHNYLWLAHSKLRQAALGPELWVGELPEHMAGASRIRRNGEVVWERPFLTGQGNMSHTIANLEHHHFKYAQFRRPGDVHVHFFGTATLSFSDGFRTELGDIFEIESAPFTLPLRNTLARAEGEGPAVVRPL